MDLLYCAYFSFIADEDDSSRDGSQPSSKKAKKGKKSISWADEESLIKVCYFELDEEERGENELNFLLHS